MLFLNVKLRNAIIPNLKKGAKSIRVSIVKTTAKKKEHIFCENIPDDKIFVQNDRSVFH